MNKKALALLSGGLDSTLAIKILQEQGIEVEGINFVSPFCTCDRKDGCRHEAQVMSKMLGIPLKILPTGLEYIDIIKNPKFGYGKNINPCIDCRIFMLKKAKKYMDEIGAGFLVTGEVLGQRPKSQRRDALNIIERETGLKGLILRPLSAKLLPPTLPETNGIVDRAKLLEIKGKSRKTQLALADEFNFKNFMCGGSGCLLTDKNFVPKLKDLFKYNEDTSMKNLNMLRVGRHFRSSTGYKIILGRNQSESERLEKFVSENDSRLFLTDDRPCPYTVILGGGDEATINEATGLCILFANLTDTNEIDFKFKDTTKIIKQNPLSKERAKELSI